MFWNMQVNHFHSIDFRLFWCINWQAVNYRISPRHASLLEWWMEMLAKIILHLQCTCTFDKMASGSFPHWDGFFFTTDWFRKGHSFSPQYATQLKLVNKEFFFIIVYRPSRWSSIKWWLPLVGRIESAISMHHPM